MAGPYTVALTGGIAAGKTAVSDFFARKGIPVWDADVAARAVVAPASPGLAAIGRAFGEHVLAADGSLDRRRLREHIFAYPAARQTLESITHPLIRAWLLERVATTGHPWCLLAIPLLIEAYEHYRWVDRVLVVEADREVRVARLLERDGISRAQARQIMAAQTSDVKRRALADDMLYNNGNRAALNRACEVLYRRYAKLAEAARAPAGRRE